MKKTGICAQNFMAVPQIAAEVSQISAWTNRGEVTAKADFEKLAKIGLAFSEKLSFYLSL